MRQVGARELKQHTGAVIARLRSGEHLLLTYHGTPIAVIAPLGPDVHADLLKRESDRAEAVGWLWASESAFGFWDNPEDAVRDRVHTEPDG